MQTYKDRDLTFTNMANEAEYSGLASEKSLGRDMGIDHRLGRGGGRFLSVGKVVPDFICPFYE